MPGIMSINLKSNISNSSNATKFSKYMHSNLAPLKNDVVEIKNAQLNFTGSCSQSEVKILNETFSLKEYSGDKELMRSLENLAYEANTPEKAEIAKAILSSEDLCQNKAFVDYTTEHIIHYIKSAEEANATTQVINAIAGLDNLCKNKGFMEESAAHIIHVQQPYMAEARIKVLEEIASSDNLCSSERFMHEAYNFIYSIYTSEDADAVVDVISKIASSVDKEMLQDEKYADGIVKILREVATGVDINNKKAPAITADAATAIFDNEKLRNSKAFMEHAASAAIAFIKTPEEAQARAKMLNEIATLKNLCDSNEFMEEIWLTILHVETLEQAQSAIEILRQLNTLENLCKNKGFMEKARNIASYIPKPEQVSAKKALLGKLSAFEQLYSDEEVISYMQAAFQNKSSYFI